MSEFMHHIAAQADVTKWLGVRPSRQLERYFDINLRIATETIVLVLRSGALDQGMSLGSIKRVWESFAGIKNSHPILQDRGDNHGGMKRQSLHSTYFQRPSFVPTEMQRKSLLATERQTAFVGIFDPSDLYCNSNMHCAHECTCTNGFIGPSLAFIEPQVSSDDVTDLITKRKRMRMMVTLRIISF